MTFSLKAFALDLLGLDMSRDEEEDLLCPEIMEDSEEDELCNEVMDRFERQRAFQSQLLLQSGGGIDPQIPVGTFEFDLNPFVDRTSATMGVRERHFTTRLRQMGNFVDSPHVVRALQDGLRRAVDRVLTTTPNLHDQDRLYFTLSSNRLTNNFQGWGLRAGEWREGGVRLDALLNRLAEALNSNEQFEMDDSFQLSITQVHHAPQGRGKHSRRLTPGNQFPKLFKQNKKTQLRQQALEQLTHEDLEAHDQMARTYPDHPHPSQRHYIQHVGNAGEYHVPGTTFTVDGFHRETNTAYEFHGCFWHGCPQCYPVRNEKHVHLCKRTMHAVYENTQNKMTRLRAQGYKRH